MDLSLSYRSMLPTLPAASVQINDVWRVAMVLAGLGLPLDDWCPPADTPEDALRNRAFEQDGPSAAALAIFKEKDRGRTNEDMRSIVVWNGIEKDGLMLMRHLLFSTESPTNSTFSLEWSKVPALAEKKSVVRLIESLLPIWPAPFVSVSEARYEAIHKVFDDRPGVGWMLYLPRTINTQQVPEAQELIAVHDKDGGQQGTIIVSIRDEPFSVDNEEHIKVAASIEMRLVEHDLLPRYSDL